MSTGETFAMAQPMRNFALEVFFSRWEFTARYNLGGSDAETLSQRALLDFASAEDLAAYENLSLGYYRLIERDESLRLPQAVDVYERAISLNVMSKAYGLAGLRIGWVACKDRDTLVRLERYKHYLSICNSAPGEILARIALKARERILERNRRIVRDNVAAYARLFADCGELFDWKAPDGGCVAFHPLQGARRS